MTTGEKIRNARRQAGYTQEQLAEKLMVSRQAIAKWEADRGAPDIENLKAISRHFNMSVDDLLNTDVELPAEDNAAPAPLTAPVIVAQDAPQDDPPADAGDGAPVADDGATTPPSAPKRSGKKAGLIAVAVVAAVAVLVGLLGWAIPTIQRSQTLRKAETLMEEGDYWGARELLESLPGNEELTSLKQSWTYEYAMSCVKNGDYAAALGRLQELGTYEDSDKKLQELYGYYAVVLYNEKDFAGAANYFSLASGEEDENWAKATYERAAQLYGEKSYGLAYNALNSLVKKGWESYNHAGEKAVDLLQMILLSGVGWNTTYTHEDGGNFKLLMVITSKDIQIGLSSIDTGKHINTYRYESEFIIPNQTFRDAGVNEVCLGSDAGSIFTFSFSNNTNVQVHYNDHKNPEHNELFCTVFTVDEEIADTAESLIEILVSKNVSLPSYYTPMALPALSFADDFPEDKPVVKEETATDKPVGDKETPAGEGTPSAEGKNTTTGNSGNTTNAPGSGNTTNAPGGGNTTKAPGGGNTTTKAPGGGNTTKAPGSGNTTKAPGGGNTTKAPTTTKPTTKAPSANSNTSPCAAGHSWQNITQTIHHDEVGHYEQVVTGYNTVTKYKCAVCYQKFDSLSSYYTHFDEHIATSDNLVSIFRERYETPTEKQPIYGKKWVVDKPAYDEQRVIGRKCSVCGTEG